MRRALLCVAVAALVVLAGCGGGGAGGDGGDPAGDATGTPGTDASTTADEGGDGGTTAGEETTATDDGSPSVENLAWVDDGGVDVAALVEAHTRTLGNESGYTVEQVSRRTARGDATGSERRTATLSASREQGRALLRNAREFTTGDRRVVQSSAQYRVGADGEGAVYSRRNGTDGVSYEQRSPRRSFKSYYESAAALDAASALESFAFEFDGTVQRDGETLYRFTADEVAAGDGDLRSIPENASNVSATLLVGERGVIHSFDYGYDTDISAVEFSFAVTALGETTVEEPDWLDAARDGNTGRLGPARTGDRFASA